MKMSPLLFIPIIFFNLLNFHGHFPLLTVQLHYHKGLEPQIEISRPVSQQPKGLVGRMTVSCKAPFAPWRSMAIRSVMEHDHGCLEYVPENHPQ